MEIFKTDALRLHLNIFLAVKFVCSNHNNYYVGSINCMYIIYSSARKCTGSLGAQVYIYIYIYTQVYEAFALCVYLVN